MTGTTLDHTMIQVLGAAAAVLLFLILRRSARLSVAVWIGALCFVPIWLGIGVGFNGNLFLPGVSAVGLVVIAALLPTPDFRLTPADLFMIVLLVIGVTGLFGANPSIAYGTLITTITYFAIGYVVGRIAGLRVSAGWISGAIAIAFTVVAVFAIVEFVTTVNPFVLLHSSNGLYATWGTIQFRGGVPRSEAAFGHSIALASSLALAIPFTVSAPFRLWVRLVMVAAMLAGCVVSFSRIGMVCAALGLILSVVFLKEISSKMRAVTLAILVVIVAVAAPFVTTVFDTAGTEASGSASYRGDLISLVGSMNLVGVADSAQRDSTGTLHFAHFVSIDSQLVLTGLTNGLVALIAACIALLGAVWTVLRGRAVPATIAIVAQIPALATVALITQYSIFLFAVAGLAASGQWAARTSRPRDRLGDLVLPEPPTGSRTPDPVKELS